MKEISYPRAAVIGNPSDGYFGKTIAFVFRNFRAEVELLESEKLEIIPNERDSTSYQNLNDFNTQINDFGYYGGIRLLKATIRKFIEYCQSQNIELPNRNFSLKYQSNIPNRLGLAGSSAIITAALKAILKFYQLEIPKAIFANLVLSVETEELGISAGLQDRVAQAFEQPVFMDFDKKLLSSQGFGNYESFSTNLFPKFYIAYRQELAEGSEVVHNNLRERFENGDEEVVNAMRRFSKLTDNFYRILTSENKRFDIDERAKYLTKFMDQNFDLRQSICAIDSNNLEMIHLARNCGASAKFTGSGGAIIGIYEDEQMFKSLSESFELRGISILKPDIVSAL